MRREFKPTLRQDTIRKVKTVVPPTEEEYEIVLNVGTDTTLHYSGSPLMDPNLVTDPNSKTTVAGTDSNYQTESWIAIGLGTDNVTNATDDTNTDGTPAIGSGGDNQPPIGDNIEYTQIGPSRAALFFDLGGIPSDAEIVEATLELVPYDVGPPSDPFSEGVINDIWADSVQCEVLNLPHDANANATWNTKTGSLESFDGGAFTLPDPDDRWWRVSGAFLLPNPIGIAQNTRRSDTGEPVETFVGQAIVDLPVANEIDGGDASSEEYYGHIGYGISGGGAIVNYDPANPSLGHATFQISLADWNSLYTPSSVTPTYVIDVKDEIEYGLANGRKANLLVRASHWDVNTAAQNPNEQLTFEAPPVVEVLQFTFAHLSDISVGLPETPEQTSHIVAEIPNNQILHVHHDATGSDADGNPPTMSYTWLIEVPVTPIDFLDFGVIGTFREGDRVEVVDVAYNGGDAATDVIEYQWIRNGTNIGGATNSSFTIPDGFGGDTLRVTVTVSNPNTEYGSDTKTSDPEDVAFDGAGTLTITKSPTSPVDEGNELSVQSSSSGVANPLYNYRWFIDDVQDQVTSNTSSTTSTYTPPDVPDGSSIAVRVEADLKEGGSLIDTKTESWTVNAITPPSLDTNGIYRLSRVPVTRNIDTIPGDFRNKYFDFPLVGLAVIDEVIEEPNFTGCLDDGKRTGALFGYWTVGSLGASDNPVSEATVELNGTIETVSNPGLLGQRQQDGTMCFVRDEGLASAGRLITKGGFNGRDENNRKIFGDIAVWLPDWSDENHIDDNGNTRLGGWIIFSAKTATQTAGPNIGETHTAVYRLGEDLNNWIMQLSDQAVGFPPVSVPRIPSDNTTGFCNTTPHLNGPSPPFDCHAWNPKNLSGQDPFATTRETWFNSTNFSRQPTGDVSPTTIPSNSSSYRDDVVVVFFTRKLTNAEALDVMQSDLSRFAPTGGAGGGGGGVIENLPNDSFANPNNTTVSARSVQVMQIENLNGVYSGWPGDDSTSVFLNADQLGIYDCAGDSVCSDVLGIPGDPVNIFREGVFGDSVAEGTAYFNPSHPSTSETFQAVHIGRYNTDDDDEWNFGAGTSFMLFPVFCSQAIPSGQQVVAEVIRDGSVIGRSELKTDRNNSNNVNLFFPVNNVNWYSSSNWQIGDIITITTVPSGTFILTNQFFTP